MEELRQSLTAGTEESERISKELEALAEEGSRIIAKNPESFREWNVKWKELEAHQREVIGRIKQLTPEQEKVPQIRAWLPHLLMHQVLLLTHRNLPFRWGPGDPIRSPEALEKDLYDGLRLSDQVLQRLRPREKASEAERSVRRTIRIQQAHIVATLSAAEMFTDIKTVRNSLSDREIPAGHAFALLSESFRLHSESGKGSAASRNESYFKALAYALMAALSPPEDFPFLDQYETMAFTPLWEFLPEELHGDSGRREEVLGILRKMIASRFSGSLQSGEGDVKRVSESLRDELLFDSPAAMLEVQGLAAWALTSFFAFFRANDLAASFRLLVQSLELEMAQKREEGLFRSYPAGRLAYRSVLPWEPGQVLGELSDTSGAVVWINQNWGKMISEPGVLWDTVFLTLRQQQDPGTLGGIELTLVRQPFPLNEGWEKRLPGFLQLHTGPFWIVADKEAAPGRLALVITNVKPDNSQAGTEEAPAFSIVKEVNVPEDLYTAGKFLEQEAARLAREIGESLRGSALFGAEAPVQVGDGAGSGIGSRSWVLYSPRLSEAIRDEDQRRFFAVHLYEVIQNAVDAIADRMEVERAVARRLGTAAADYHGRIEVRARKEAGRVTLEVSDNGIGIPNSFKEYLFGEEPFTSKDSFKTAEGVSVRTRAGGEGKGLGLFGLRLLQMLPDGNLEVETFSYNEPGLAPEDRESPWGAAYRVSGDGLETEDLAAAALQKREFGTTFRWSWNAAAGAEELLNYKALARSDPELFTIQLNPEEFTSQPLFENRFFPLNAPRFMKVTGPLLIDRAILSGTRIRLIPPMAVERSTDRLEAKYYSEISRVAGNGGSNVRQIVRASSGMRELINEEDWYSPEVLGYVAKKGPKGVLIEPVAQGFLYMEWIPLPELLQLNTEDLGYASRIVAGIVHAEGIDLTTQPYSLPVFGVQEPVTIIQTGWEVDPEERVHVRKAGFLAALPPSAWDRARLTKYLGSSRSQFLFPVEVAGGFQTVRVSFSEHAGNLHLSTEDLPAENLNDAARVLARLIAYLIPKDPDPELTLERVSQRPTKELVEIVRNTKIETERDYQLKYLAIAALAYHPDARQVGQLVAWLKQEPDPSFRVAAIVHLYRRHHEGGPELKFRGAWDRLTTLAQLSVLVRGEGGSGEGRDPSPLVRSAAIQAIARLAPPDKDDRRIRWAIGPLRRVRDDAPREAPDVRRLAGALVHVLNHQRREGPSAPWQLRLSGLSDVSGEQSLEHDWLYDDARPVRLEDGRQADLYREVMAPVLQMGDDQAEAFFIEEEHLTPEAGGPQELPEVEPSRIHLYRSDIVEGRARLSLHLRDEDGLRYVLAKFFGDLSRENYPIRGLEYPAGLTLSLVQPEYGRGVWEFTTEPLDLLELRDAYSQLAALGAMMMGRLDSQPPPSFISAGLEQISVQEFNGKDVGAARLLGLSENQRALVVTPSSLPMPPPALLVFAHADLTPYLLDKLPEEVRLEGITYPTSTQTFWLERVQLGFVPHRSEHYNFRVTQDEAKKLSVERIRGYVENTGTLPLVILDNKFVKPGEELDWIPFELRGRITVLNLPEALVKDPEFTAARLAMLDLIAQQVGGVLATSGVDFEADFEREKAIVVYL